jgi:hypothetical protein
MKKSSNNAAFAPWRNKPKKAFVPDRYLARTKWTRGVSGNDGRMLLRATDDFSRKMAAHDLATAMPGDRRRSDWLTNA